MPSLQVDIMIFVKWIQQVLKHNKGEVTLYREFNINFKHIIFWTLKLKNGFNLPW